MAAARRVGLTMGGVAEVTRVLTAYPLHYPEAVARPATDGSWYVRYGGDLCGALFLFNLFDLRDVIPYHCWPADLTDDGQAPVVDNAEAWVSPDNAIATLEVEVQTYMDAHHDALTPEEQQAALERFRQRLIAL